jgi:asparagine synthase (glutamine-hydrolysing)
MCGILGIVGPEDAALPAAAARRALDRLAARGPDDAGVHEGEGVWLGHRRLAVMDLSAAGHQPMASDDGRVVVVYNGEIYGFRDVRTDLERRGHRFRSSCDTEVLLRGYEEWGRDVLLHVDGMFALGVWDARERKLLLARDRLGKKPLFWARRGDLLGFASGVRPLLDCGLAEPAVPRAKLREFLFFDYTLGPQTIFRDVEQLPPASWLEWHGGRVETGCYWRLGEAPAEEPDEAQRSFERLLREATAKRLVSDAPLGVFLSGGVDSAVVTALARQAYGPGLATFSVGFEDRSYDERSKARRLAGALGTVHHELLCGPADVPGLLAHATRSADHLLADQSLLPLAKLAIEARRSVKVVVTGDGGDELLAGYPTYRALQLARSYVALAPAPLRRALAALAPRLPSSGAKMAAPTLARRFLAATGGDLGQAHASWRAIWSHREISALLGGRGDETREWAAYAERFAGARGTLIQRAVAADVATWLVDSVLAKVDRATMAVGLEARSPLLDSRLWSHAFANLLSDPGNAGKRPLRRLAARLLPPEFARAAKETFQTPFAAWFAGPLRGWVRGELAALPARLPGAFDAAVIGAVEAAHSARSADHALKLWSLLAVAEWAKLHPGVHVVD